MMMLNFLTGLVFLEGLIAALVMLDLPALHMFLIDLVSALKSSRASVVVKILAASIGFLMTMDIYYIYRINRRIVKMGSPTPADHFMLRTYLLEFFLTGSSLFLLLVINHLHNQLHQIASLEMQNKELKNKVKSANHECARLQKENDTKNEREHSKAREEIMSLKDLVSDLRKKMESLQLESLEKDKAIKSAEVNAIALQKQAEGFLLEYDRLLEDNQNLRSQLMSIDRRLSHSDSKKYA